MVDVALISKSSVTEDPAGDILDRTQSTKLGLTWKKTCFGVNVHINLCCENSSQRAAAVMKK